MRPATKARTRLTPALPCSVTNGDRAAHLSPAATPRTASVPAATASLLLGASLQGKQCVEFNLPFKFKVSLGETCQPGR